MPASITLSVPVLAERIMSRYSLMDTKGCRGANGMGARGAVRMLGFVSGRLEGTGKLIGDGLRRIGHISAVLRTGEAFCPWSKGDMVLALLVCDDNNEFDFDFPLDPSKKTVS